MNNDLVSRLVCRCTRHSIIRLSKVQFGGLVFGSPLYSQFYFCVPSSRKSLKIHGKTVHLDSGLMALPYHCQGIFQKNFD